MTQGKLISTDIGDDALQNIRALGVHVQTIARIEAGEPGVSVGHLVGYGVGVQLQQGR